MSAAGRPLHVAVRHRRLRVSGRSVGAAVRLLDSGARSFLGGCPPGELSLAFLTDGALAALHGRYLADFSRTDVITFAGDPAHGTAGEICISVDAAARHAARVGADLSREITLYMVHGWLHLAGYDDRGPASRRRMRRAEARAMRLLARAGAVPRFKLA
ncbi:MAG TPA: rRNA maturation RNase YbeY [Opitutaceae bacterium]|nr:rRNA maturation RNase YbeY [Opitutaceae bacterium]